MKRILLSAIALIVGVVAFAQNAGEYVYTKNARVKIISGKELVENGNFADGVKGWTTDGVTPLSTDTFAIAEKAGPNDDNALITLAKENGPATGSCLYKTLPVQEGMSYLVSYWVKTDENFTSIVTPANNTKNYQNVIFNEDGKLYSASGLNILSSFGSPVATVAGEWKQVAYVVKAPNNGYLSFYMYAPYIGQSFAGFSVKEVMQVPDDRIAKRYIDQLNTLVNDSRWNNGKDILNEVVNTINELVKNDDLENFKTIINMVESEVIPSFLDQNTTLISNLLVTPNFDDATPGQSTLSKVGGWTIDWDTSASSKSRWGTKQNTSTYLSCGIPANYELPQSEVWQTVDLPKGKYMYTMQVAARRYLDKNNTRIDTDADIKGLKVFRGKDSIECTGIDTLVMHRYTVETELTEDGPVRLGFYQGTPSAHLIMLDLTELRAIDNTESYITDYFNNKKFATVKETLKQQIETATELLNSTDYIFEKSALKDSITKSQGVYDHYLVYSENNLDSIENQTKRLQRGCSYYKKQNAEYIALAKSISDGKVVANNADIKVDKTALNNAIVDGETYYNSLTISSERDSLTLATKAAAINREVTQIEANNVSADTMLKFYVWSQQQDAVYEHKFNEADEPIVISAGSNWTNVFPELGLFAGQDLSSLVAFRNNVSPQMQENSGLTVTSAKNNIVFSLIGLKEGNEVIVDWKVNNGSLFVGSGNATFTKDDGSIATPSGTGETKYIKVEGNQITNTNTDGINNTHRTVFVMTKDGSLDFLCSSASTTTFAYIGINEKATPTAINNVNTHNTPQAAVKVLNNGRILIKTIKGTFTVSGIQIK